MSQPASNQDWPAWLMVVLTAFGLLLFPAVSWVWRKLTGGFSKAEILAYLKTRDENSLRVEDIQTQRHTENLALGAALKKELGATREWVANIDGRLEAMERNK